jgi:hypothetical protein
MCSRLVAAFIAVGVMVFGVSTWAHHAHGNYAVTTVDMEGVVSELHLLNPHSWLYIEVTKADGQTQMWALEAGGRGQLLGIGVTPESMKVGSKVKVRCHPLSDGTPGCLLGFVKTQDGTVRDWDGNFQTTVPKDF